MGKARRKENGNEKSSYSGYYGSSYEYYTSSDNGAEEQPANAPTPTANATSNAAPTQSKKGTPATGTANSPALPKVAAGDEEAGMMPRYEGMGDAVKAGKKETKADPFHLEITGEPTNLEQGLTSTQADEILKRDGPNSLVDRSESKIRRILHLMFGPTEIMMWIAAVISAAIQDWTDFGIIVGMLFINTGIGIAQDLKSGNALKALKASLDVLAHVKRDGKWVDIKAADVVCGDVMKLVQGQVCPADVVLLEGDGLQSDQSALTGESLPVHKVVGDSCLSGSIVKVGEMVGQVVGTGENTAFGQTAKLVSSASTKSHFQAAIIRIGNFLIIASLLLIVIVVIVSIFRHEPGTEIVVFALILLVAAIPIALPVVLSVTMAVGAVLLSKHKAIVARLVAVEELASVQILCSDKTGTLTLNQLECKGSILWKAKDLSELYFYGTMACNLQFANVSEIDAIDRALIDYTCNKIINKQPGDLLKQYTRTKWVPFDPVTKYTEGSYTDSQDKGRLIVAAKGAPQTILKYCNCNERFTQIVNDVVKKQAEDGFRVIAVARRVGDTSEFLGLIPLYDPPRPDSAQTISEAQELGVEVKMITGDHLAIAKEVAGEMHMGTNILPAQQLDSILKDPNCKDLLLAANGFAQVLPEHKFNIVKTLQGFGFVVAMTGDGVNDSPALKQAEVGVAVSGATDAARGAASLVLTEPGLGVIIEAIKVSRQIFARMESYAVFRITETVRILIFNVVSVLALNFKPLTPVMLVLLAIFVDFPILTIARDNAPVAPTPIQWKVSYVCVVASVIGLVGVAESFFVLWFVKNVYVLSDGAIQSLFFVKLLVGGHLCLYVTRCAGDRWFWNRPFPSIILLAACELTQVAGTVLACQGWGMAQLSWAVAGVIWAYSLVWLFINNAIYILVQRCWNYRFNTRDSLTVKSAEESLHRQNKTDKLSEEANRNAQSTIHRADTVLVRKSLAVLEEYNKQHTGGRTASVRQPGGH